VFKNSAVPDEWAKLSKLSERQRPTITTGHIDNTAFRSSWYNYAKRVVHQHSVGWLEVNDRPDGLASVQQVEGGVDLLICHVVSDVRIDVKIPTQLFSHHPRQLAASQYTFKSRSAPDTSDHQLEGSRGDFFARAGNADYGAFAPTFVATLPRQTA